MSPGLVNLRRAACLVAITALSACPVTAAAQEESMLPPGLYRLEYHGVDDARAALRFLQVSVEVGLVSGDSPRGRRTRAKPPSL